MKTNLKIVSKRQARKLQGGTSVKAEDFRKAMGLSFKPFVPTFSKPHPSGMNRLARRRYMSSARGKGETGERSKTRRRGEAYGRQLENLIRSRAPLSVVQDFKRGLRTMTKKRVATKLRSKTKASQGEAVASLSKTTRILTKKIGASSKAAEKKPAKKSIVDKIAKMVKHKAPIQ